VSEAARASVAGGVVLALFLIALLGFFMFIWLKGLDLKKPPLFDGEPLGLKVLPQDLREQATKELKEANQAVVDLGAARERDTV